MLQRVVMLAAESLKVLEHQLMDGGQIQDVKVGVKHLKSSVFFIMVQHRGALTGFCVGDPAPSSGRLRCADPPQPQAGSPAQPGSGPSHCQLQQGCHECQCGPARGAPACHRLQPCGPLFGRAQSESCWFGVLKGALGVNNTLWMQFERTVMADKFHSRASFKSELLPL